MSDVTTPEGLPPVNILLVDDEPANLVALEAVLDGVHANLVKARSGEEAILLLREGHFAVVLMDVRMPTMNGYEAARIIRSHEHTRHVPIIFVTAHDASDSVVLQAYKDGAADHLFKPLVPVVLRSKVENFVEVFRQAHRIRQLERQQFTHQLDAQRQQLKLERLQEQMDYQNKLATTMAESARHKDEFLAMLAHELRSPLAPILNSLNILKLAGDDRAALDQSRSVIERQVRHMARLVDDLLDVSRLTRGKIQLRRERLDLVGLLRTVAEDRRPGLADAGLALDVAVPDAAVCVTGDATRLAQVLYNLLDNAVKFSDPGGRVELHLAGDEEIGRALITVRDEGVGIEPSMLSKLFTIFAQADRSLDRARGGLGLGLALAKGLVDLHGGEILAASDGPGHGATFTVGLPLAVGRAEPADPGSPPPPPGNKLRILVIEDNPDTAETTAKLLRLLGHETAVALTGAEGVRTATAWGPDVVLCDIGLPGLDGFAVARELRAQPPTANVRLVAVTGYAQDEDRRRAHASGFDAHLVKPVDLQVLEHLLGAVPAEEADKVMGQRD